MNELIQIGPISPLRQRLIDDMTMRRFSKETQRNYLRDVGRFATWLGRSPHTASAEDVRQFQIEQQQAGVPAPTMNSIVGALRFFFTHTLDRPDLARKLVRTRQVRKIPVVLTMAEVKRLLDATRSLKHQAALSVAYGAGLRVAEVSALKVTDIDSKRMLLRIERGKGGRYRNAMLPEGLLLLLRDWWRAGRQQGILVPDGWLFPGQSAATPINPTIPVSQRISSHDPISGVSSPYRDIPASVSKVKITVANNPMACINRLPKSVCEV
mgnify:CR=1 FL=1